MTTTETDTPPEGTDAPAEETDAPPEDTGAAPPAGEPPITDEPVAELEPGPRPRDEALWTRGILPIALPVLAIIATAVWVVNLSRAFLAGGKDGALVIVVIITLTIMIGASLMSAATRMRESSQLMVVAGLISVIIAAGFVTFGPSEGHEGGGGYVEPKGKPVATLSVTGGPGTYFDKKEYTLDQAGVIAVHYTIKGSHTLKIQEVSAFPVLTKSQTKKVELKPGKYTIYCTISGHRAAGMQATVIVK